MNTMTHWSLGSPEIFISQPASEVRGNDCACADDGFDLSTSNIGDFDLAQLWQTAAQLWAENLTEEAIVVFDPFTRNGPIVLNQDAWRFLARFAKGVTITEVLEDFDNNEQSLAVSVCRAFVSTELLYPPNIKRIPKRGTPQTLTAWIHLTNECNLRCTYCYLHKTPNFMAAETGRRSVNAVFRSAVRQGFRRVQLKFAGGEATLNFPLILLLHAYATELAEEHQIELDPVVLSNGVGLTKYMIQELKACKIRLMISLDGLGEYHDAQRVFVNGVGSFRSVGRSLERLLDYGLRPSLSIVVSNKNLAGLPEIVQYALDRQLPFSLNFYRENECSASNKDLIFSETQIISAMRAAFRVVEANVPPWSMLDAILDRTRLDRMHDRACGVGQSYMVINEHGSIAKCHMTIEQTLTDIYADDPLKIIQDDQIGIQNLPVIEKEGCRDCSWRYWCAGGCPLMTYRATGRWDIKSPNCNIYKALFPEVIRLEGLRLLKYGIPIIGSNTKLIEKQV